MENRDDIIRKLNALRAKANNAGTPEEAIVFMDGFNKLMQKYKLTETDLEIRSSRVEGFKKSPRKEMSDISYIVLTIAELTETRVIEPVSNNYVFLGLGADLQYANWLFDLILHSMDRSWTAYKLSRDYHERFNKRQKPAEIKNHFMYGFSHAVIMAMRKMIEENRKPGQALVLLKNAIVKAFMEENKLEQGVTSTKVTIYDGFHEVTALGYEEGNKVRLRKEAESVVKGYLN